MIRDDEAKTEMQVRDRAIKDTATSKPQPAKLSGGTFILCLQWKCNRMNQIPQINLTVMLT
jgi:hypothetical protein